MTSTAEMLEFAAHAGTLLRGTLTMPEASDPVPAALLLSGSGPLDRHSNMPGQALNVGSALAAALAFHGVGSLRFDKRGIGRSSGDYLTTGFEQETHDAAAALEELRRRDGIESRRIIVIGHSVGATIAMGSQATMAGWQGRTCLAARLSRAPTSCAGNRSGSPPASLAVPALCETVSPGSGAGSAPPAHLDQGRGANPQD